MYNGVVNARCYKTLPVLLRSNCNNGTRKVLIYLH